MKTYTTDISDAETLDSGVVGPTVTFIKELHGDEESGNLTYEYLCEKNIDLIRGRIKKAWGNPKAAKLKVRYTEKDPNRLFDGGEEFAHTYEYQRVQELKKFITEDGGTDILLDAHTLRKKPEEGAPKSFVTCANPEHPEAWKVLTALGISPVLTGSALLGADQKPIYSDTFAATIGAVGITIEAGYLQEPQSDEVKARVLNVLAAYGMIEGDININKKPKQINAHTNIMAGPNFAFNKYYATWDVIPPYTVFAKDDNQVYSTKDQPAVIIFPKAPEMIRTGEEACILADIH